jgi:hypothetical protein
VSTIVEAALDVGAQKKFSITVVYNGVSKSIEVQPQETIKAVFEHALRAFGPITVPPHTLALFNEAGQELNETAHVNDVGIKPGDKLLLRARAVQGGAA